MHRSSFFGLALVGCLCWHVAAQPQPLTTPKPKSSAANEEVSRQISRLEAELNRLRDSSPEAADVMLKLTDLYYQNSRLFGLIRVGNRFIAAHPSHKRHGEVMFKLMDGLEATSRNKELTVICRQYLTRYPNSPQVGAVELRLAEALTEMNDLAGSAEAYRAVWRRAPGTLIGQKAAVVALNRFAGINDYRMFAAAAEIGEEMIDKLPAGKLAGDGGMRAVGEWRRCQQWAKSNLAGNKMLSRGMPTEPALLRDLHSSMAENYANLGQFANAVESYRKARAISDSQLLHWNMILRMSQAGLKPEALEPVVNEYVQKYPTRLDRHAARSYLAVAYLNHGNKPRAVQLLAELLPFDAVTNGAASLYVRENAGDPKNYAETEQTLRNAIAKNPDMYHQGYLRYVLAMELLRDRTKELAKTAAVLREMLEQSPTNDHYSWYALDWLLLNVDEANFQAEVARLVAARQKFADLETSRNHLAVWVEQYKNRQEKEFKARVPHVRAELEKANADPMMALWLKVGAQHERDGLPARAALLEPARFNTLNDRMAMRVLQLQGIYYWHYSPNNERQIAASIFAQMAKRFPKDYTAAVNYVHSATDYNAAEVMKEAAIHLISLEPEYNNPDTHRRLMIAAERNKDADLARRVVAWMKKSEAKFGRDPQYAYHIGDMLTTLKLPAEASDVWATMLAAQPNSSDAYHCVIRLMSLLKGEAKIKFLQDHFAYESDYFGQYGLFLAEEYFQAKNFALFEKTLREIRTRQDARLMRAWGLDEGGGIAWIDTLRASKDIPDAVKRNLYSALNDLQAGRTSAGAHLALLEMEPDVDPVPLARLLKYQQASRMVGNEYYDWDRLMTFAQAALSRQDYAAASTLLTGMLSNISNADAGRRKAGREMAAQCFARMGTVGFTIDDNSPIAPLMQAALYLRLGDDNLALETFRANKALFDKHRDEVPVDLIVFVCESYIAAGGDKNHEYVEEVLRAWLIKHSEAQHLEPAMKARVQLLLAKNYFKAQRFDLARSEFTTTINRYPGTPQAIEAEFGIGETFLAQKVYDQAEIVFEKLATSKDNDVVVRAEFLRGVLAHRRGDRDEARKIFRNVLDRVPNIEIANQTLFNLAEVYGAEERYIEQLNLLRTVGRLGRASKRWHAPGTSLSIVVQDSDLGISRGHSRIPVLVRTEPGGDSETVYLTTGGGGKGLFRVDLDTRLGAAVPNDRVLQLSGKDIIRCDYPKSFKDEFKNVPLSDVEIHVASDGEFKMASNKIVDEDVESFSDRLKRESEAGENEDRRVSQNRPATQVKPGNLVYIQVKDADRDLTTQADTTIVKLSASSGDQVQVRLTETGPHTGIFEGTVKTGELPAGATASDTAIEHSPLMAIDRNPESTWLSEPDGAAPKWLTVDLKDLKLVSKVRFTTPDAKNHAPVRGALLGSNDGRFWFPLGSNPPAKKVDAVLSKSEKQRMHRRVYNGNFNGYGDWNQILTLSKNGKPASDEVVDDIQWSAIPGSEGEKKPHGVLWHGKLIQERSGAARIQVDGMNTALVINGDVHLAPGAGTRTADVWLETGTHLLTVFASTTSPTTPVGASIARADYNSSNVSQQPFRKSDFDLSRLGDETGVAGGNQATGLPQVETSDRIWQFRFKPMELRYVKLMIHEYLGQAVAINHVEVMGDDPGQTYIPTETDVLSLSKNDTLEIAGGDVITGTYADEFTQSTVGQSRVLTSTLTATYFDARVSSIAYDFGKNANGQVYTIRKQLMRINPGERLIVEIVDYDKDQSAEPDTLKFQVFVNDGDPVEMTATETDKYTGVFTKEIDTSATKEEGKLTVKQGDRIYIRYIDAQNTFPGHATPRETVVYVAQPTEGQIRIYETRVIPKSRDGKTAAQTIYRAPPRGKAMSSAAFEAPFTVEVIDPDAAKDSLSHVDVTLTTTDGSKLDVRCVISPRFSNGPQGGDELWPLQEGRFVGQVILQLGGKTSPQLVPLTSEMPRDLVGGPVMPDESKNSLDRGLVTKVLNVKGTDIVRATYKDAQRPGGTAEVLSAQGRLVTNGQLAVTDRDYQKEITQLHVGERLYLVVTDADQDSSDERDRVQIEVTTDRGEKEVVTLEETLAHSGVFTGSFHLRPSEKPVPGNITTEDPFLETYFGDNLKLRYVDKAASTETGELVDTREVPVVVGTDGLVAAFSKTFSNEKLAVDTKFHMAESYFELFKSHKKLGRRDEQKQDLEAGRRLLKEVLEDYPDPKYIPRVAYLLGQFAQELEQWAEAIESYEMIIRQYADHPLAQDAQYKLAQCYEESGDFDRALDAYVTLAATYPKSPLISSVMIRICDHYFKAKNYPIAAQVGEKFLERFDSHQYASRISFLVGQCYYKAKNYQKAGTAFDGFVKKFPDDALCADALFWSGESYRSANDIRKAFWRFNRCRIDFPSSESAKYARGRLALPEMLRQFESEANSVDMSDQ